MTYEECQEAVKFIHSINNKKPEIALIFGTGLGINNVLPIDYEIDYSEIPNFPVTTTKGNVNKLVFGTINNTSYVAQKGRFHYYEGYTADKIISGVRIMNMLGAKTLMLSNAAGGINPNLKVGDLMIINDQINLLPNPLIGKNDDRFGPRFPDMTHTYSKEMIMQAKNIAIQQNLLLKEGVYVGTTGPSFETPAEYKYFGHIGADAVGMSTTQEVIIAKHLDMKIFGVSVITNEAYSFSDDFENNETDVLRAAYKSSEKLNLLFYEMIKQNL